MNFGQIKLEKTLVLAHRDWRVSLQTDSRNFFCENNFFYKPILAVTPGILVSVGNHAKY